MLVTPHLVIKNRKANQLYIGINLSPWDGVAIVTEGMYQQGASSFHWTEWLQRVTWHVYRHACWQVYCI